MTGDGQAAPVLVVGATGLQGGAVVEALRGSGLPVRALTRSPQAAAAQRLRQGGVEVVGGDLEDPSSLLQACQGVLAVFSVQDFYAQGVGEAGELRQAQHLIEAARRAGVRRFVQSTMGDAASVDDVPHFRSKHRIEEEVRRAGFESWTLLGTVWFLENLLEPRRKPGLTFPVLAGSLRSDTRFPMLSVADLGTVAAKALRGDASTDCQKPNLAGDVQTVNEMKAIYRQVTGRRPKWWRLPNWALAFVEPEFAAQLRWHVRVNFAFDSTTLRQHVAEPTDLRGFLQRHRIIGL